MSETKFKPVLGLWDATMIVAGSMIGSGIFIVSADITRNVGSAGWLVGVWLITGFMTMVAAVSYGELSGMFPKAGGQYVYLKEAFNPLVGFLYGWSFFAVIQTATIAAVGVAFARFSAYLFPWMSESNILLPLGFIDISAAQVTAIIMIIFLTWVNTRGVKEGKLIQSTFTASKLIAVFGLIVFGFLLVKQNYWSANWQTGFGAMQDLGVGNNGVTPTGWKEIGGIALLGAIAAAMTGSLFSSDAWNNVTFIAGEIKNPQRNIGLSLFLGTLIVTVLYVTANLMYLYVLPLDGIAYPNADRLAIAAANQIFGPAGQTVIAVLIMVSTFGCNNGLILAGARVYYTMAQDGLFFKKAGELNKNAVPQWALWAQCVVACLLCLSGRYGDLLDMISFVVVIFYALTIAGIFILRKTRPDVPRPYKAFGYPVLPALYIVMGLTFCVLLIWQKPVFSGAGLLIVLIGIPLYYIALKKQKAES
ncbi:APC family permease [Pseudochryseolinea flava]|uniref:Amino acid transporter n=1 Tax=Pseudochryseolinea flava TaxID=2059302 RepID=A0A364XXY1_9BACT|nr:amino acid permease [Pseudochryseolinea flava]RAV98423.1 amino acid transporter [Pseudochryseolinea flava]